MASFWTIAGFGGHALAAVLFSVLAIAMSRRPGKGLPEHLLIVALTLTALWSLRASLDGVLHVARVGGGIAETIRNGAWCTLVIVMLRHAQASPAVLWGRRLVIVALALVLALQMVLDLLVGERASINAGILDAFSTAWLLRCTFALGALSLLHGLAFTGNIASERPRPEGQMLWIGAILAFMWAYDFNHYMLAWATGGALAAVGPMRGIVMAVLGVMLTYGLLDGGHRRFSLSRAITLRLISLGILALYLLGVGLLVALSRGAAEPFGRILPLTLLFGISVAVLALLPSAGLRAWLKVQMSKHLFAHRYDYRAVWMGFTSTVAEHGADAAPLTERLARAAAQVVDAPAALLFVRDEEGVLSVGGHWNWDIALDLTPELAERLEQSGWIVDLTADRHLFGPLLPDRKSVV